MEVANSLAYYGTAAITAVESFKVQVPIYTRYITVYTDMYVVYTPVYTKVVYWSIPRHTIVHTIPLIPVRVLDVIF
jgi:hypothetical protein